MTLVRKNKMEAVVFDMDGVIIDSTEIWKRAEREVFSSVGVQLSDELCKITEAMTTAEVTQFWFDRQPWRNRTLSEIENGVIDRVAYLIRKEGKAIRGIERLVKSIKSKGYKVGLATNSPSILIPAVLGKLKLERYFDAVSSADCELKGKPDPSVYLAVANKLNVGPEHCVAVEDSFSGLLAAKKAGMKTVILSTNNMEQEGQEIADFNIHSYDQFDIERMMYS